jgi:membrane-associated phospholipid phosphatase
MWLLVVHRNDAGIDRFAFSLLATTPDTLLGRHAKRLAQAATVGALLVSALALIKLMMRRCWVDTFAILVGYPLVWLVSEVLKADAQRPRPRTPILPAGGFSFPSTDSAISIGFVVLAVALARLSQHPPRKAAILALGTISWIATGALMVAFRVHYLTDVLGGWGLGVATFAASSLAAIVARDIASRSTSRGPHLGP